jgi:cytochrome o ubiquinol oxidase operon protein cyoD
MSAPAQSADARRERAQERRAYVLGLVVASLLTAIPFALVATATFDRTTRWWIIGLCGLAQIVVHFRFFLHIDLSRQKREDLQLILFSVLLLAIMAGGTIWILFDLYARMMPGAMPH